MRRYHVVRHPHLDRFVRKEWGAGGARMWGPLEDAREWPTEAKAEVWRFDNCKEGLVIEVRDYPEAPADEAEELTEAA